MLYHGDSVEFTKMIAYACFWLRKLKPVSDTTISSVTHESEKVHEVNEYIFLYLMKELTVTFIEDGMVDLDPQSTLNKLKIFFEDKGLVEYITHSMRRRTFGPHHYVIILKMLLSGVPPATK